MSLSFIIVTFNSTKDISELLKSLQAVAQPEDEIIIVDNASTDNTLSRLHTFLSEDTKKLTSLQIQSPDHSSYSVPVHIIENSENLGFGHACNQAARIAQSDILLFVNPDCTFGSLHFRTWLQKALTPSVGAVAPLIRYPNGAVQANQGGFASIITYILQFYKVGAAIRKFNLPNKILQSPFLKRCLYYNASVRGFLENYQPSPKRKSVDWVSGAFMLVPKKVFESVQGFDTRFFLYCEDEDLCRRIRNLQGEIVYDVVFDPGYEVLHKVEGSKDPSTFSRGQLERYKSNIFYLKKWNNSSFAFLLKLFYIVSFALKSLFYLFILQPKASQSNFIYLFHLTRFSSAMPKMNLRS